MTRSRQRKIRTTTSKPEPTRRAVRLQKYLASCGVASRREAERIIQGARVEVNGRIVSELGTRVDPDRDAVRVDGRRIRGEEPHVYFLLHKPTGYITSAADPQGRPTVLALLPRVRERIFPVGRLDWSSEGLLILTNDGDLALSLTHPRNHVPKVYRVKVKGIVPPAALDHVRKGVILDARRTRPARVKRISSQSNSWIEITLFEGRRNQIRRMFKRLGHPVLKLRRVAIGPITDRGLLPGRYRELTPGEILRLQRGS